MLSALGMVPPALNAILQDPELADARRIAVSEAVTAMLASDPELCEATMNALCLLESAAMMRVRGVALDSGVLAGANVVQILKLHVTRKVAAATAIAADEQEPPGV